MIGASSSAVESSKRADDSLKEKLSGVPSAGHVEKNPSSGAVEPPQTRLSAVAGYVWNSLPSGLFGASSAPGSSKSTGDSPNAELSGVASAGHVEKKPSSDAAVPPKTVSAVAGHVEKPVSSGSSSAAGYLQSVDDTLKKGLGAVASAGSYVTKNLPTSDSLKAGLSKVGSVAKYVKDTGEELAVDAAATARNLYTVTNIGRNKNMLQRGTAAASLGLTGAKYAYRGYKLQKNVRSAGAVAMSSIKNGVSATRSAIY